jgi:hypothetical protein
MMIQKKIHSMDRVNGFESLPYLIKSYKKMFEDEEVIKERGGLSNFVDHV